MKVSMKRLTGFTPLHSFRSVTGFTLVEVLITVAIASFILAAVVATLNVGDAARNTDTGLLDLQQEARLAMNRMTSELRQSNTSKIDIDAAGGRIDFSIPTDITTTPVTYSDTISYYLDSGANQIIREYPAGTSSILANDITSISFSLSGQVLDVQLDAGKTVMQRTLSLPLREKVRLRNE